MIEEDNTTTRFPNIIGITMIVVDEGYILFVKPFS